MFTLTLAFINAKYKYDYAGLFFATFAFDIIALLGIFGLLK